MPCLKGVALDWFEPNIIDPVRFAPAWVDSWVIFSNQFQKNFGPHNQKAGPEEGHAKPFKFQI
jgi:hypothetical protein